MIFISSLYLQNLPGLMGRSISTATNMTVTTTFSTASGECSETWLLWSCRGRMCRDGNQLHSASKTGKGGGRRSILFQGSFLLGFWNVTETSPSWAWSLAATTFANCHPPTWGGTSREEMQNGHRVVRCQECPLEVMFFVAVCIRVVGDGFSVGWWTCLGWV